MNDIYTIDLEFQGLKGAIAAYLIPYSKGAVLVECGPGSTLPALEKGLSRFGFGFQDLTDVIVTHIHLDHAGAAGWLARQGAQIHVHPAGAPHMIDPEKLLASAGRIYGDMMNTLWGEFLSVSEEKISIPTDGEEFQIGELCFRPIDTPGHAGHHYAFIFQDVLFSGDIGGVRVSGLRHLRLPMPPPEFHLEKWRESIATLRHEQQRGSFTSIAPTHFDLYPDAAWHLEAVVRALDEVEEWMEKVMPANPDITELRQLLSEWNKAKSKQSGLEGGFVNIQEAANPSFMSADGIFRYWKKYRQ